MSVLITGGCGYIGSHMVWELHDSGESVVVIDNLSTGFDWVLPKDVPLVVGDIGDQALVGQVIRDHGVNAIIHFAGSIVVPDSVTDPLGYYFNNTVKSRGLIEEAVSAGVNSFIFSSTAAVYGIPDTDSPIAEDMPLQPISPYGSSKLMTEIMLRDAAFAYPDFNYTALRYFNVAGADPKGRAGQSTPRATHLIKVANQTALGDRSHMDVFGTDYNTPDGTCVRDYIHVSDLAKAHALALARLRDGGDSLVANCGYGHGYSVLQVLEAVKRASGVDFAVNYVDRRAGDPPSLVANSERAGSVLGWEPSHADLDLIVETALSWERMLLQKHT
ncbi:UDP-glucose 4-epimerase GalE [Coralliovum pocilloporae]|uniref:UDP-glucose 4-epimerase GalE n=1 Tax=Coralliovum pocilloporae TaxID=3066369 RepID=UPI0033072BB0